MAIIQLIGFETGDTGECASTQTGANGTLAVVSSQTHGGTYSLQSKSASAGSNGASVGLGSGLNTDGTNKADGTLNKSSLYTRFYFKCITAPPNGSYQSLLFYGDSGAATLLNLVLATDGSGNAHLAVYNAGGLLATGTTVIATGTWYRIELKLVCGSSAAYEARIGGVSEINGSITGTVANIYYVYLGTYSAGNGAYEFYFDDVWIDDAAYPPDGGTQGFVYSSNGTYTGWTGTPVTTIPHAGDASAITTTADVGGTRTINTTANVTAGVVNAVKNSAFMKAGVHHFSGNNATVALRLRSGTTDSDTVTASPTPGAASYTYYAKLYATDPATSAAWTKAALNAAQPGVRELASGGPSGAATAYNDLILLMADILPGTLYTQSFLGSVAGVGVLTRQAQLAKTGTSTASGVITKASSITKSGSMTSSGFLAKKVTRGAFTGAMTAAGVLAMLRVKIFSGSLTGTGSSIVRLVGKGLTGVITSSATLAKAITHILTGGSVTETGVLTTRVLHHGVVKQSGNYRAVQTFITKQRGKYKAATSYFVYQRGTYRSLNTYQSKKFGTYRALQRFKPKQFGIYKSLYIHCILRERGIYRVLQKYIRRQYGRYRAAQVGLEGYVVYVGTNVEPDLTAAPFAYSASLPWQFAVPIPPNDPPVSYHIIVRYRDSYGLVSQNQRSTVITVDRHGNWILPPVPAPTGFAGFPVKGGVQVMAQYPTDLLDDYPADKWRVWINTTVPNLLVDVANVTASVRGVNLTQFLSGYGPGAYNIAVALYRTLDAQQSPAVTGVVTVPPAPAEPASVHGGSEYLPQWA